MKVLMVCLGNICRSPLAEGILKEKLKQRGLAWHVESAGTGSWHVGSLPDKRSIDVAAKYSIDITDQRARKIRGQDFEEFDLIFAMDTSNYSDLMRFAVGNEERNKIKLILNEIFPEQDKSVPDPYWDDNGFENVFNMLDQACDKILDRYG